MNALKKIEPNSFAAACYDMNSIADLRDALNYNASKADMATWNITADEWRAQIELAIAALEEKAKEKAE